MAVKRRCRQKANYLERNDFTLNHSAQAAIEAAAKAAKPPPGEGQDKAGSICFYLKTF